jgi:antitoxin (DNA-binding transcriptional repressor) of toxin-antitoxin stability system
MRTVSFTEFRQNASALFSAVEEGEIIHVMRHGKEIAEISPLPREDKMSPSWKKQRVKLSIPGKAVSEVIIDERENAS